MIRRQDIYSKEAAALLRDITLYHCMHHDQIIRLYPGKESQVDKLLMHLVKQGRILYESTSRCYYDSDVSPADLQLLSALWVLADFGDKAEYHSTDTYPVQLIFFADGETYEVIYVPQDKEALIVHALSHTCEVETGKCILIVEDIAEIDSIPLPNAIFCTVDSKTGKVDYYQKE